MFTVEPISEIVSELAEGPLWDPTTSSIIWTDIPQRSIHISPLTQGSSQSIAMPMMIGAIALTVEDSFIAATQHGFAFISRQGEFIEIEEFLESDLRMNDGKVDPAGRFWAGSLAFDFSHERGSLYFLDKNRVHSTPLAKLTLSNGMGWSPSGEEFFFIDSIPGTLSRYDFDVTNGVLSNQRVIVNFDSHLGIPDGMCVTNDGFILVALWDGGRLELYDPNGTKLQEFKVPVSRPTSCCFAGDDYSTLIVTTASQEIDRAVEPLAGRILSLTDTGLSGLPSYRYG
jgi:sugar lactone lactonase YvrE